MLVLFAEMRKRLGRKIEKYGYFNFEMGIRDPSGDILSKFLADESGLWAMVYKFGICQCIGVILNQALRYKEYRESLIMKGQKQRPWGASAIRTWEEERIQQRRRRDGL